MTAPSFSKWSFSKCLAAGLLLAMGAETRAADEYYDLKDTSIYVDNTDHDLQFFSPVDFDFENRPIGQSNGYFFSYDKLSWSIGGERNSVGVEGGTSDASTNPWRVLDSGGQVIPNPDPDGDPEFIFLPGTTIIVPAPTLPNAINSAPPRSGFAWGERYEFGYYEDTTGLSIGILDGPESNQTAFYGFGFTPQDDTNAGDLGLPSPVPNGPNQLLSPLGSVLVVFDDPQDIMLGWLDVVDGTVGNVPGGVLETDSNDDGVLDGDGFADDIDRDGQYGPDGIDTETPGEIPDRLGGGLEADFDDLVFLPTSFQTLVVRNNTELQGIEIIHTHRLSNRHRMAKFQNNDVEFTYGARYLRLRDQFNVNGEGGVLGSSFWDTTITNNLVGPQIGLKWLCQKNRIRYDFNGRFLFGYNVQNWEQTAALGEDLIPGQHNHPLYFPPSYSHHGKSEQDFSPLVEMRLQASYQITRALAAKLGYTATFIDNIRRASQQVKYELPNMGFRDGGTQEIFVNGVNFGFEAVY